MDFSILEMRRYSSPANCELLRVIRTVRDYEIDMELGNGRNYRFNNNEETKLHKGDILVRKPGENCSSVGTQSSYILTLDFSNHISNVAYNRNMPGEFQKRCENPLIENLNPIIHPSNPNQIMQIYERLLNLLDYESQTAKELVKELIFTVNAEICKQNYELLKSNDGACDIVMSHLKRNLGENISLEELADLVHLEKSYLIRLFRKTTGKTPIEALIDMRMEKAADLVANTNLKIHDIAVTCGYNTPSFFISEYKKRYNITPESHRNLLKMQ